YQAVNAELALFDPALAAKPQVVAINKIDQPEVRERLPAIRVAFAKLGIDPVALSGATGEGVREILDRISRLLEEMATAAPISAPAADEPVVLRPRPPRERFVVEREANAY